MIQEPMTQKKIPLVIIALLLAVSFAQPITGGECFTCEFVDIGDPNGGGPNIQPTCFEWGDDVGWRGCQEFPPTCLLVFKCFLFA